MRHTALLGCFLCSLIVHAQVRINEGSSRNYRTIADEDGSYPDWIELYNAGDQWVNLQGYALSDDVADPDKWVFPAMGLDPGAYLVVFCDGKDRTPQAGQTTVGIALDYTPTVGWNTHTCAAPFTWDGSSNLLIEVCAVNNSSTSLNAVVEQTTTPFNSTTYVQSDSTSTICAEKEGNLSQHRPVVKLNGVQIGNSNWTNNTLQFPSPYANWFAGAKHAMLFRGAELQAAGLTAGPINTIAFNVVATGGASFDEIDLRMGHVMQNAASAQMIPWLGAYQFHTNFSLARGGEDVFLFSPAQQLLDEIHIEQEWPGHSNGRWPDGDNSVFFFETPTPGASNDLAEPVAGYADEPTFSVPSTMSATSIPVVISNPNPPPTQVRYTLDGSDPTNNSPLYTADLTIATTTVLKARSFAPGLLPSKVAVASYLIGAEHASPVLSITTANENLIGAQGIFTNWWKDDEVPAYADFFETDGTLLFSQRSAMQMDGGMGGSRTFPQKSFRLEFDNGTLGSGTVDFPLIPDRPARTRYSRIYLRNGSNQHLFLPHKDATQVRMMAGATNSYYSAWRPVTVYINGAYFGLYELREKFDGEYFSTLENADNDSLDLLTLSAWSGQTLHANTGSSNGFWEDMTTFRAIEPTSPDFWEQTDALFDLTWYTDYIIGQQWMGTTDWPINNVKIQRSNATGHRWRFCTVDLEVGMAPNGQTDHTFNALLFSSSQDPELPYTAIWQRGLLNPRFHDHYINRFADVMNSAYLDDRIQNMAQEHFDRTRPDMGDQLYRWMGPDTTALLTTYTANHEAFLDDLAARTPYVRDDIQQFFALPRQVDVTLDVHPAGAGKIHISTLQPDNYPWEGVYFDGVPVRIEAVAEPGFIFHHWGTHFLIADTTNAIFLDTLAAAVIDFDAYFEPDFSSIGEHAEHHFSLLPNPTTDMITVIGNEAYTAETRYEVVDPRGVLVAMGTWPAAQQRSSLDASGLAHGVYQLRLFNGQRREVLSFVKL